MNLDLTKYFSHHQIINHGGENLLFSQSCRLLTIGPSKIGKSTLILECLKAKKFPSSHSKVLLCNPNFSEESVDKDFIENLRAAISPTELKTMDHIPSLKELQEEIANQKMRNNANLMIICDDFGDECFSSQAIMQIFTRYSAHNNIDCILILQNAFSKEKYYSIIVRNTTHFIVFNVVLDRLVFSYLSKKMFPKNNQHLEYCMQYTLEKFGNRAYICINGDVLNPLLKSYETLTQIIPYQDHDMSPSNSAMGYPIFFPNPPQSLTYQDYFS